MEVEDLIVGYVSSDYVLAVDLELYKVGSPKRIYNLKKSTIELPNLDDPEDVAEKIIKYVKEETEEKLEEFITLAKNAKVPRKEYLPALVALKIKKGEIYHKPSWPFTIEPYDKEIDKFILGILDTIRKKEDLYRRFSDTLQTKE